MKHDDKRYRECMVEIAAILKRYEMAGAVTVVDKERAMFRYLFPSWSCITIEGDAIRFRAKRGDYPSLKAQHEAVELSTHIILQMRDIAAQTFRLCEDINDKLKEQFEIEHQSFKDFDPEREH